MPRGWKVLGFEHVFYHIYTGKIPATIGNLTNLQQLWLQNNKLSGASRSLRHT